MRASGLRLPLLVAIGWIAAVGLAERLRPAGCAVSLCLFRNVTGLPCPTCGSTRALGAMLRGHPLEALALNPLVVIGAACAAAWGLGRIVGAAPRQRGAEVSPRRDVALAAGTALLVAANWWYVLAHDAAGAAPWH